MTKNNILITYLIILYYDKNLITNTYEMILYYAWIFLSNNFLATGDSYNGLKARFHLEFNNGTQSHQRDMWCHMGSTQRWYVTNADTGKMDGNWGGI